MTPKADLVLAVLNGAIGNYLSRTRNGLATQMAFMQRGREVPLQAAGLSAEYPAATSRIVVLVHGLMCTESIWKFPDGSDYGSLLANELGYTPLYIRYNTGLSVADNGENLATLLEELCLVYPAPIEEILLLGYSMGGLVVRCACQHASVSGAAWLSHVRRAIYVGTPHEGVPLERGGRILTKLLRNIDDPYTRLIGSISELRSDGVKNLGDAATFPLLSQISHYLIAGTLGKQAELNALFGDAIVPVGSATHRGNAALQALSPSRVRILPGVGHLALARCPEVFAQIRGWCEEAS